MGKTVGGGSGLPNRIPREAFSTHTSQNLDEAESTNSKYLFTVGSSRRIDKAYAPNDEDSPGPRHQLGPHPCKISVSCVPLCFNKSRGVVCTLSAHHHLSHSNTIHANLHLFTGILNVS